MAGHGQKLDRLQETAVANLLAHPTVAAAAEATGVSERQLRSWMRLPRFAAALRQAREQILQEVVTRLLQAGADAVACLRGNLTAEQPGARNVAARTLLEMMLRGSETLDLAERIRVLEQQASGEPAAIEEEMGDDSGCQQEDLP